MTTLRQLSGQSIGPYELRELYGVGGMGAVYRAYHRTLDRDVGFKVMSLSYSTQTEFKERFEREAKLAASLEHPHIVPIYDYAAMDDWQYVVMRLLTGGSLAERIEQMQGQPPSLGEISSLLQQLAGALDYAHSRNIVHRDIKSNNIMFDAHGTAYIVDFGIAKLILDNSTRLTADGMTVGTPTHMAPELWSGEDASAASDQYALGIVVYELLTGRVPFNATSPFALMNRHIQETPEPVQKYAPQLSSEFDMILWRALSKERLDRYPTVTAFAKDFVSVAQRTPQVNTGIFTMELRRELLGTQPEPIITDTPLFSGAHTITPPSMPAPPAKKVTPSPTRSDPLNAPAAVANGASNRPALKSLSALQKAQAAPAAAIPSALPRAEAAQAKPAASIARPKATAPMSEPTLTTPEPAVKERIVFVERKDRAKTAKNREGLAQAVVDSISNLFGLTLSSATRASIALALSALFTVALIVGIGVGLYALLTSPAVGSAFNQLRNSLASIGQQGSPASGQTLAATPVPQGPPPPPGGSLPPPPPGGGLPRPPRR